MCGALPKQICYHQRDDARVPDAAFRSMAALSLCASPHDAQWTCDVSRGNCSSGSASCPDVAACCGAGLRNPAWEEGQSFQEKLRLRLELFVWHDFILRFASRMP